MWHTGYNKEVNSCENENFWQLFLSYCYIEVVKHPKTYKVQDVFIFKSLWQCISEVVPERLYSKVRTFVLHHIYYKKVPWSES